MQKSVPLHTLFASLAVITSIALFGSFAFAEDAEPTLYADEVEVVEDAVVDSIDEMVEAEEEIVELSGDFEGLDYIEGITEEAAIELIETTDEITEESANEDVLVGTVLVSTDTFVIVETGAGQVVKVRRSSSARAQRRVTSQVITTDMARPGYMLTFLPTATTSVTSTGTSYANPLLTVPGKKGETATYALSENAVVVVNGEESNAGAFEDITEDTTVTVVLDEAGEVVAVTLLDDVKKPFPVKTAVIILAALVVLWGGRKMMRKS